MADSPGSSDGFSQPQAKSLRLLRLIWGLLLGEIVLLGALVVALVRSGAGTPAGDRQTLLVVSLSSTFVAVAAGYFMRMQAYKKHWVGNRIAREGYFTGNLILFALIEAAALFGLVTMYLARQVGNELIPVAVCAAFLLLNFPNGRPMLAQEPELARRG